MSNWPEAFVFGAVVLAFVLGLSSLIMSFLNQPVADAEENIKVKVEYGFFGVSGLIISLVLAYAL
ncbi:hypothetical protein [Neptunicella marina]|uniref:Uncharacterized protein n=1 Tax=Neptunicella marina TaxID=2125989 RepID=A0A8J6J1G6_9ALTE|nr:hypothetical protein [Neptunicella marina]MBC3767891.1 hypothetical protein [Neptunicella marina]